MEPEIIERLRLSSGLGGKRGSLGGLYQQKRDQISLLTDPKVVAHLNQLNQAFLNEARQPRLGDAGRDLILAEKSQDRERLEQRVAAYNQANHGEAFMIALTEGMNFEGALRFYFNDGSKMIAKALRLNSCMTVQEIMPSIKEKFNILDNGRWRAVIYQVQHQDEIRLANEERPLDIAVNCNRNLRFVLKMERHHSDNQLAPQNSATTQRKSLSQFFGVESSDLAVPYYAGSTETSPTSKHKFGLPSPKFTKKGSVDSLSLSSNGSANSSKYLSVSNGKRSKSIGNIGSGGLVLKADTPNFIRKFQSSDGTLRSFIKKDKGNAGKVSSKGMGLGPRRRSRAKSLSYVFEKGLTLLRKDESSTPAKEADSEESSPGLLKIFGDKICPNATYKSVLASAQSSAVALVKVVLERYALCVNTFEEYVLCDVIGNYKANPEKASRVLGISEDFEEKQEWVTECMRVLGDDERPLLVKSYWKPEVGFSRRFEIRRHADISVPDTDTITHGINLNAKRLQMTRANRAMTDASLASFTEDQDGMSEDLSSSFEPETVSEDPQRQLSQSESEKEETESNDEQLPVYNLLPPQEFPYLLTLQGDNPESDQILYLLDSSSCLIGHTRTDSKADLELDSSSINQEHCRILTQYNSSDDNPFDMSLEPVKDSKVLVNGKAVSETTQLNSGDLIGIGDHYLFLLKNPLAQPTEESPLTRLMSFANQSDSWTHPPDLSNPKTASQPKYASPRIASMAQEYSADRRRLKLSYPMRHEDKVLSGIASLLPSGSPRADGSVEFTLSLAYLTCMCVEHSAYNFHQERTKRLMMKVASLIQVLAWDKTKEMAKTQPEKPSDVQSAMDALLPDLRLIVCLLTNALEILNFLQSGMGDYVAVSQGTRPSTDEKEVDDASLGIEDEALVELEEVVMYTFQQTVYYLTKTLYISIPNFLDTNPFADCDDEDDHDTKTKGMDSVLSVFQMTFDLMRDMQVHPEITSQLFAYLLFFTNASLFNMLVETGSGGKFYKWSKGAQIRGNLDILEGWIQSHGLQDQAKFLTRVSMAIDLLATPKVQLMQANWSSLQSDFSELNTAQLHNFLARYQLAANQSRPSHWLPPAEEMKSATDAENLLESFDNHPALALPNHGFELDLKRPIPSQHFMGQLQKLKRLSPYITFNTGIVETDSTSLATSQPSSEVPNRGNKSPSSPSSGGLSFPVPPPRTRPYRYPQSRPDAEADTSTEVLERPLEVVPAAPVSLANTVKLPPSEGNFLSKAEKMSPRVFANKPLFKVTNATSKSETPVQGDSKTNVASLKLAFEEPKKPCPSLVLSPSTSASSIVTVETEKTQKREDSEEEDVFVVDLEKGEEGVGLGLIDGMHTPLRSQGIYVRKLVPGGSAGKDGRLIVGDRILAVNGTSLVGADYNSAMQLIRTSGKKLRFLVAKSEPSVALKITASTC